MDPDSRKRGYFNYPEPIQGPDVPYRNDRKSSPVLRGPLLIICRFIMEYFGIVRQIVWRNAGFASLRTIAPLIEDYEPRYDPTVVPLPDPSQPERTPDSPIDPPHLPPAADRFPTTRYYTAADYHAQYLAGTLTPTDVARTLLPLIRKADAAAGTPEGPHAVAWFQTREDLVLRAAEASTERYRAGTPLGPLDGVPTGVKDEYDMDGYTTCLGSRNTYTGTITEDGRITAWAVRKLEEAGAVVLGALHMVEFGLDTPGNNPVHGTPRNPYHAGYYTGGSSSGSAYAVAAGLVPFALGSDGGGSVRIPAAFCSAYGLKPTHGRVSFKPGQNHCVTCACLGPIAADVRTLATVYAVLAQPHPTSLFPAVQMKTNKSKILGVPEAWFRRADEGVQELCRSFIERLVRDHGYRAVPIDIPFLVEGQTAHAMTVLADAATLLPTYDNLQAANRILLALGRTTPATDYVLAQKLRAALTGHLSYLWHKHPGMVIVTPTTSCAGWPVRSASEGAWGLSDGDTTMRTMEYVWLANFVGLPSITMPAGYVVPEGRPDAGEVAGPGERDKVPVGLMATGEWATETDLLRLALDAEHVSAERFARAPIWVDVLAKKE